MADRRISIECDDRSFFHDFFLMFGGPAPRPGRADGSDADMHLSIVAGAHPEYGWFRMTDRTGVPIDAHEFSFDLADGAAGTFERMDLGQGWNAVAFRGSDVPAFAFSECASPSSRVESAGSRSRTPNVADCLFHRGDLWRRSINWFLFWRLLRVRDDAIFFHASSLNINGHGTIFVGPKGAGKSTTSLALAARGHNFLSDEIAAYVPATGEVIPFRRPVGIKPGPRATAVQRGLDSDVAEKIDRDGFVRVDVDSLFSVEPPRSAPLRRIVFLRGFREKPDLARIRPGREEIVELQPLMSSFLNAAHSRRVFELVRLLSTTKVYRLHPGNPDETAEYLEEVFAHE